MATGHTGGWASCGRRVTELHGARSRGRPAGRWPYRELVALNVLGQDVPTVQRQLARVVPEPSPMFVTPWRSRRRHPPWRSWLLLLLALAALAALLPVGCIPSFS